MTDADRRQLQNILETNKKSAPNTQPYKTRITDDERAEVRDAVRQYISRFDVDTVTAGILDDEVPDYPRSKIGNVLASIADRGDFLERTPFNPIGGRRYRVHPDEL